MLKKDADPNWDYPTEEQCTAFETLNAKLIASPVLAFSKKGRPCMIDTDVSAYQLGAVLLQQQDENDPKSWVPIGNWSKSLSANECQYSATERGYYSVLWAVNALRLYIEGLSLTFRTDQDALKGIVSITQGGRRLMRWCLRMSEFDFQVNYRPGLVHQVATHNRA